MRNKTRKSDPPKLGQMLLEKIYGAELFDEISGDMAEIYERRVDEIGTFRASLHYMKDSFLSLRNYDLKYKKRSTITQNNSLAMFENYLKTTFRNISKNKVYSILNISGLALGIAACLFILQYVSYERSYDTFHENFDDLYRVRYKVYRNGELNIDCAAAVPRVGPFMKENMPEVKAFARAYPMSGVVRYEDKSFWEERMHMADPAFLQIFSFPLVTGNPETALSKPNTMVISESAARKYFGNENPIGKVLKFDWDYDAEITAIAKDVPANSHIRFDMLISYATLNNRTREDDGTIPSETAWGWYDFNTYVLLEPETDIEFFDSKFAEVLFTERGEDFEKYDFKAEFPLQPIKDIHLYSNLLQESEPDDQGDGDAVFFLGIIAFFILVIAWINYINLSTARSIERAKEVGIRKTMGAYQKQLIYQFLAESFVLNFLATCLALAMVTLGIKYFNQITDSQLSLAFLSDAVFWLSFNGIFLGGAVFSGLYPAFVLSSFKPVTVLKGSLSGDRFGNRLRKVLVVFQFGSSVFLIAGTMIVYEQLSHMRNIDVGFDMTNTLVVRGPEVYSNDSLRQSTIQSFKNELTKYPEVKAVSSSTNIPGDEIFWTSGIKKDIDGDDKFKVIYNAGIDYKYFETYDIEMLAGRSYSPDFKSDTSAIVLNKTAIEYIGFSSPEEAINEKVTFWGEPRTIIGVVGDYNQRAVKSSLQPISFPLILDGCSYITLQLEVNSDYQRSFENVQGDFQQFFPGNPFDYFFLDKFYDRQYNNEKTFSRVFVLFAGLAIVVACLGLFGLSSFSALKRTKEIGIRKALGAATPNIILLLAKDFMILVLISNMIAWPIIYLFMNNWLENFAIRINIGFEVFIISTLAVMAIALITVAHKTIMTARSNPVKALRYE